MKKVRKWFVFCVFAILVSGICGAANGGQGVFDYDPEFYPYYPSLIKWNKSAVEFTPPEVCRGCHPGKYEEWTGSVHALAFQDPVYQGELNKAVKAVGHEVTRQCEGCHSAAGMVTGEIGKPGLSGLSTMALAGVSCDICHSISGTTHWQTPSHEPENGSFILTPGVDTQEGARRIKRGPLKPPEGCGMGFHECAESSLHLQADLCAGCHQVYHYEDHFPLEATYLEWKHGAYAQRGILCQDCHMVDLDTFKRTANEFRKPQRGEYLHFFNGANYLLYHLAAGAAEKAGDHEKARIIKRKYEMAVKRLQSAAGLEVAPLYRDGALSEIRIRVKNERAGHNLPTSLTNVRQMWLEVTAKDTAGRVLMTSGAIYEKGLLQDNTRVFNSDGMGKDFHFAIDPWVVIAFSRHDTIPPKGYRDVYYGITVQQGVEAVIIEAKLRYRQADQSVAEALLGAVPKDMDLAALYGLKEVPSLPIVDMVSEQRTFSVKP